MKLLNNIKTKLLYDNVNQSVKTVEHMQNHQYSHEIYDIISHDVSPAVDVNKKCIPSENFFKDIEMFQDYDGTTENTVIKTMTPHMKSSVSLLKKLLENPVANVNLLERRRDYLSRLETSPIHDQRFQKLKELETDALWVFVEKDETLRDLFDIIYFKWSFMSGFNKSPGVMTASTFYKIAVSPVVGIVSPIVYFIIPYLIVRYKFKLKISFMVYIRMMYQSLTTMDVLSGSSQGGFKWMKVISYLMSILFYFQGVFNSIELSKTFYKLSKHITDKMNVLAEFAQTANDIISDLWTDDIGVLFFSFDNVNKETKDSLSFTAKPFSMFSNFGKQLSEFKNIDIQALNCLFKKTFILDVLYSIKTYKQNTRACFASYEHADSPIIKARATWHPCLNNAQVVKNDIELFNNKNAIITGPNAGGKSTFIKSMLINILFAQTTCVCLASEFTITPFDIVNSQINVPDSKGHESLFEAEMYRCKHNLDLLKENPDKKTLIILDEMFSSTNPVEGIAGAFAIAKRLAQSRNCMLIFTTHFTYLTKLATHTDHFTNFRMNVKYDGDTIIYPYKLENGVSKQYIALELLKKNGFDEDIINEALHLKTKFTS